MKEKYYISDRISGVWFRTPQQLIEYYRKATQSWKGNTLKYTLHHGNITEIKYKEVNKYWKQCTI